MTDRLSFWIVVTLVATVALPLALGGWLGGGILPLVMTVGLMAPAILCILLFVRAVARSSPPRDLLWRGRRLAALSGPRAWLVPAAALVLWSVARWSGAISVSCFSTSSELSTSESWSTITEGEHKLPMQTDEPSGPLELGKAPGEMQDAFRSSFANLQVAGKTISGHVALELDPPFAAWPLWKSASRTYRVNAKLVVWQSQSPPAVAGILDGHIDGEGSWSMLGFATERDFHANLGKEVGAHARQAIDAQLQKLVEKR
jgi:hypothetical protein